MVVRRAVGGGCQPLGLAIERDSKQFDVVADCSGVEDRLAVDRPHRDIAAATVIVRDVQEFGQAPIRVHQAAFRRETKCLVLLFPPSVLGTLPTPQHNGCLAIRRPTRKLRPGSGLVHKFATHQTSLGAIRLHDHRPVRADIGVPPPGKFVRCSL